MRSGLPVAALFASFCANSSSISSSSTAAFGDGERVTDFVGDRKGGARAWAVDSVLMLAT